MSYFKNLVQDYINQAPYGKLNLHHAGEIYQSDKVISKGANIFIHNAQFYRDLILKGPNGIAKGYMKKIWSTDSLDQLFEFYLANLDYWQKIEKGLSKLSWIKSAIVHKFRLNSKRTAQKNIHQHYDLSNDFFKLFLDPTMMYSCAYFKSEQENLNDAALNKCRLVCDKLNIQEGDRVLEIGSGWGGMAIMAAKYYGAQVTTITISKEQYNYCKQLIKGLDLEKQISVQFCDYRDMDKRFDKIISIEMIEAVGFEFYQDYYRTLDRCLKPGGQALIQAITIKDQEFDRAKYEMDFIKEYIFPGGCLPSTHALINASAKNTQLNLYGMEDIGQHYVLTLTKWLENFHEKIKAIKALGFDDAFCRMWEYYLTYCRAGFSSKHIRCIQFLWEK